MHGEYIYGYGLWSLVALNALFFLFFILSFLAPVRRREWRSFGVTTAFVVALFTEALTATGDNVSPRRALSAGVLRYPLFFADIDAALGEVTLTMETPRRHSWGMIPVPAF